MPTHDYIISNGTGAAVRADINSALSAIVSLNSSASEPGTMYAYQLWADTGSNPSLLKIRNGANSAWITLRQLDGDFSIVAVEDGLQATPSLTFTNDLNTGIFRPGNDSLAIVTGATRAITITSTQAVGIQTANPSTALHVAGNTRVGADSAADAILEIGEGATGNRNSYIDIVGDTTYTDYGLRVIRNNTGANATSELKHRGTGALNFTTQEAAAIVFNTTNSPRLTILAGGNVGIGTSSVSEILHIKGGSSSSLDPTVLIANGAPATSETASVDFGFNTQAADPDVLGRISTTITNRTSGAQASTLAFSVASAGSFSTRMTLTGTGLGIGITSPNQLLQINSTSVDARLHITNSVTGSTNSDGFQIQVNNNDVFFHLQEAGDIYFQSNSSTRAVIDSSGRLLVGTSSSRSWSGSSSQIQIEAAAAQATQSIIANSADSLGALLTLGKSRGTALASNTIVQADDILGRIYFYGADGSQLINGAHITAQVDGTPGTSDMPGRLVFSTTADGGSSPTERMRITSSGYLKASNSGAYDDATSANHELRNDSATAATVIDANNNSYTGPTQFNVCTRAANSAYSLFKGASGDGSDLEFNLRGDGQAYADGSWNGGGADYAEYFEWSDLNPNAEDRRGISVVLDGNKIREAQADEDPIGVISGNPSVVGDAAWNKWSDKYLRDEFGTYIQEDYEVEDEDGNTVVQQRRKLNPAYDPDVEYVSREQRPEWDCVGLMGKLRIRKGQITGSRWIKMRDINDSVEEWLVR